MTREIPAAFDSIFSIESEPGDTLVAPYLMEHVRLEAFTNGDDKPGNYIIQVRTRLPADLAERERVAAKLGIDVRDGAIPYLPSDLSEPIISRVGFELRNSTLLRPRPLGDPDIRDIAHELGIDARWQRKDREHILYVRLSVGTAAISQALDRSGIDNLRAYEAPETQYETEELVRAVETGRVLVCKQPATATDIDAVTALVWPLHDNVFHLYSNILLQTPEFTKFVRAHGANREPGQLDGRLASAGAVLHRMSGQDWYDRPATVQAPYRQFRRFLYEFIDPKSQGAIRLNEELEAMAKVDDIIGQKAELDDTAEALLKENRAIMDRSGNVLDQLDPIVSSIITRFIKINPLNI